MAAMVRRRSDVSREYETESEMEIGAKFYLVEGAIRIHYVPKKVTVEPSGPEDLYKEVPEAVIHRVFEIDAKGNQRPVELRTFMRKHGTVAKTKLESDYWARSEAAYEERGY